MAKIIEPGTKSYQVFEPSLYWVGKELDCSRCGCKWIVERDDPVLIVWGTLPNRVSICCPQCDEVVRFNSWTDDEVRERGLTHAVADA